jgi:hypothetical protein
MILWRSQRTMRFVRDRVYGARVREDHCTPSKRTTVFVAMLPVAMLVGLASCGSAGGHDRAGKTRPLSPAEVIKRRLEANTPRELAYLESASGLTLARVGLPGEDVITILAIRCGTTETSCYRFAEGWEEPTRYVRAMQGEKSRTVRRISGTGPAITDAGPGERVAVLYMVVTHECAGPPPYEYPYAFAYGLLRGAKDTVTDRAGGRTVSLKKVVIPARLHPEGVLAYRLLLPGPNEIVVRAPDGHVLERRDWQGSNEEASCGARRK